ncbi:MAG: porin, partial [Pollutimonas bauzanensis]
LLGVAVPVGGKGTVVAQWSLVKPDWSWADGAKARSGQVATLGYVHSLSPRTNLYAMAGLARRYSLDDQLVQGQGTTTRYMAGINHSF